MPARLRAHLSYANVMSTVAVFIVLGGGAYAAAKLPKNSVGTKQIKNGAVTKAKLAKSVAVGGTKGDTGAQGPAGAKGDPGAAGTPGTNGTNGKDGTNGVDGQDGARGPSDATVVTGSDDADLSNDIVATYILPGGKYLASAKVTLTNTGAATATASCVIELSGPTVLDTTTVKVPSNAGANQTEVNMQAAVTSGSNFLLVVCDDAGGTVAASQVKMSVLTVENLL